MPDSKAALYSLLNPNLLSSSSVTRDDRLQKQEDKPSAEQGSQVRQQGD